MIRFLKDLFLGGGPEKPTTISVGVDPLSDLVLVTPSPVQFRVTRGQGWDLNLARDEGSAPLVIDDVILEAPNAEFHLPVFVADHREAPTFLLGIDPQDTSENWMWHVPQTGAEVCIEKVSRTFRRGWALNGLQNVSVQIHPNQFVGIYGPSGSGKSTMVEMILGLSHPQSGRILIDGSASGRRSSDSIAYLPQYSEFPVHLKAGELLDLALVDRNVPVKLRRERRDFAISVSCFERENLGKKISTLSGGQRRRLALAIALCKPQLNLLIADEPTTGLDPLTEREIMGALRRVSRTGVTVIVITHSADVVNYFDRILVLRRRPGRAAEIGYDGSWRDLSTESGPYLGETAVDRIGWLTSSASFEAFPQPLDHSSSTKIPANKNAPRKANQKRFQVQMVNWMWATAGLQARDRNSLLVILLCAFVCVLFLHLGVGVDDSVKLGILLSVAAPWLAATYASTVTSKALPLFSQESFAGARPSGFVMGVAASFVLPVGLIASIFWLGLHVELNKEHVLNVLTWDAEAARTGGATPPLTAAIRFFAKNYTPVNPEPDAVPGVEIARLEKEGWGSNPARKILGEGNLFKGPPYEQRGYNDPSAWLHPGVQTFIGMLLLCYSGAAIGLWTAANWKNERIAVVACVVIFVVFLVLSRAVAGESHHGLMGPAAQWWSWVEQQHGAAISTFSVSDLLPILLSFLSLSRYGFNLLFYHTDSARVFLMEALLVASFGAATLLFAMHSLRREKVVSWYFSRE